MQHQFVVKFSQFPLSSVAKVNFLVIVFFVLFILPIIIFHPKSHDFLEWLTQYSRTAEKNLSRLSTGWDKTRNWNGGTEWRKRNGDKTRNGGSGMGIKRGMAEAEWG